MELIFESQEPITLSYEDGGAAIIVSDGSPELIGKIGSGMFVRIQSWDENETGHREIKILEGKRVRITLEVIE